MKRFKGNRGVSEIIAALLMIVITIAAFSLVIMTTNTWITAQRFGPILAMQERLTIETVWFNTNATGKYICIYSRNVGKVELSIYSLRVNNVYPSGKAPTQLILPIGLAGWMNATYNWSVDETYKVELFTDRGSVMVTYASPTAL